MTHLQNYGNYDLWLSESSDKKRPYIVTWYGEFLSRHKSRDNAVNHVNSLLN